MQKYLFEPVQPIYLNIQQQLDKAKELCKPYENVNLECDGFSRIASYLLNTNNIPHKIKHGIVKYNFGDFKDKSLHHWWIQLKGNMILDYRLQMWFGKSLNVPHAVFNPVEYNLIEYREVRTENWIIEKPLFDILVSDIYSNHFRFNDKSSKR